MTRLYGRSMRGERARDSAPHGHWCVRTLIGSIRGDGRTTCMTIDAPTDNDVFLAYVRKVLLPSLRPGDIVVLDNLRSHKTAAVAEAIRSAGAEALYLPAYSPDLNPIEKMWSKIKATLRAIAARTSPALHRAIRQALLQVTPRDAAAWFASCGYTFFLNRSSDFSFRDAFSGKHSPQGFRRLRRRFRIFPKALLGSALIEGDGWSLQTTIPTSTKLIAMAGGKHHRLPFEASLIGAHTAQVIARQIRKGPRTFWKNRTGFALTRRVANTTLWKERMNRGRIHPTYSAGRNPKPI